MPAPVRCITLTTDFGLRDWFVGTMKGVILNLSPRAVVVDLTHDIEAGDIRAGAFALAASYSFFPVNTIHVAVVDPGVGSTRRAIAVKTSRYTFVGPDNGVLSWALASEKVIDIRLLENRKFFLPQLSATFHGRDVFAPAAAHLSLGTPFQQVGPRLRDVERLKWPEPQSTANGILGEVLYLDRFGNAITNIAAGAMGEPGETITVYLGRNKLAELAPFYDVVPPGSPVAVVGSSGFLEIAVNGGNAAKSLGLRTGIKLEIRFGR